jgi:hypothetical protein
MGKAYLQLATSVLSIDIAPYYCACLSTKGGVYCTQGDDGLVATDMLLCCHTGVQGW